MKKKLFSLFLALLTCLSLCFPVLAASNGLEEKHYVEGSLIRILQERADAAQEVAQQKLSAMPNSMSINDPSDINSLIDEYARISGELDELNLSENAQTHTSKSRLSLVDQQAYIETLMAAQGTIVLTDDDLNMLFGGSEILIQRGDEDTPTSRSYSNAVILPTDTKYNAWTYSGIKETSNYYTYAIAATPKYNQTNSTLYYSGNSGYINKTWGEIVKATMKKVTVDLLTKVVTELGGPKLGVVFSSVTGHSSSDPCTYDFFFVETLTPQFVYVYNQTEDRYSCELITHSDKIVYNHRVFGMGYKYEAPDWAVGSLYSSPFEEAVNHYKSGSGITLIDRISSYTVSLGSAKLKTLIPLYVRSVTNVN